jgi:hypothetical protein
LTVLGSAAANRLVAVALASPEDRAAIEREARLAVTASQPAEPHEIAALLHRLSLHYPDRRLSEKEATLVACDWIDDLADVPADLIEAAFKRWRTGPKSAFFPRVGEVLALIETERLYRRALARRGAEVLERITATPYETPK